MRDGGWFGVTAVNQALAVPNITETVCSKCHVDTDPQPQLSVQRRDVGVSWDAKKRLKTARTARVMLTMCAL